MVALASRTAVIMSDYILTNVPGAGIYTAGQEFTF